MPFLDIGGIEDFKEAERLSCALRDAGYNPSYEDREAFAEKILDSIYGGRTFDYLGYLYEAAASYAKEKLEFETNWAGLKLRFEIQVWKNGRDSSASVEETEPVLENAFLSLIEIDEAKSADVSTALENIENTARALEKTLSSLSPLIEDGYLKIRLKDNLPAVQGAVESLMEGNVEEAVAFVKEFATYDEELDNDYDYAKSLRVLKESLEKEGRHRKEKTPDRDRSI